LFQQARYEEALESFRAALAADPEDPDLLFDFGCALQAIHNHFWALAAFDRVLEKRPRDAKVWYLRADSLARLDRFPEASAALNTTLSIDPKHPHSFRRQIQVHGGMCDWTEVSRLTAEIEARLRDGTTIIDPASLLFVPVPPALQLEGARAHVQRQTGGIRRLPVPHRRDHSKIRLGYVSCNFRSHISSTIMAELIELHDRSRFEVFGFSFGPDDKSELRSRMSRAFDEFHDVASRTDVEIARMIQEREIDIAIDPVGHMTDARCGILAHKPAPIQVVTMNYAATTGADFIDYLLGDAIVSPFDHQPFFTERIVQLPDCYLPSDSHQAISDRVPPREELGLPKNAFVFCALHYSKKISEPIFDVWLRLLQTVDGSVLWLLQTNEAAAENQRRAARARGLDPERLIFARRAPLAEHLARQRQADLYLDTLPYNAHTVAKFALWIGLPIVTCTGQTFASRVCASILHAAGLPELVAHSLDDYEKIARKLATEPETLQTIRARVNDSRTSGPLFDTDRLRRNIETAYTMMWEKYLRGETPRGFRVEA